MQLKQILVIALSMGSTYTAPIANGVTHSTGDKAVINSRFGAYEFDDKKRDMEKAVINSRFRAYEFDEKQRDADKALIDSRVVHTILIARNSMIRCLRSSHFLSLNAVLGSTLNDRGD